jgi:hypothetical protein
LKLVNDGEKGAPSRAEYGGRQGVEHQVISRCGD